MTTPRSRANPILRLAPLSAFLVVCAWGSRADAGCAHPAGAAAGRTASLRILEIADAESPTWSVPGRPCTGPRCRTQAPAADAPLPIAGVPRLDGCLAVIGLHPDLWSPAPAAPSDPRLRPILGSSTLERPPRVG